MCTDCDDLRPDISVRTWVEYQTWDFALLPHSQRGDAFLTSVFAHIEGGLTKTDLNRIVRVARAGGLVVVA
jgi:hypothetical protein